MKSKHKIMEKKYFVKTRNWHCRMWVRKFLDMSHLWGTYRGDSYSDGDGKFMLETNSKTLAIFTYYYFMLFYVFSGGWTYVMEGRKYIKNSSPDYAPTNNYKGTQYFTA